MLMALLPFSLEISSNNRMLSSDVLPKISSIKASACPVRGIAYTCSSFVRISAPEAAQTSAIAILRAIACVSGPQFETVSTNLQVYKIYFLV